MSLRFTLAHRPVTAPAKNLVTRVVFVATPRCRARPRSCTCEAAAVGMAPVPDAAASQLPKTYKCLVGRHVGERFRDVCEEEVVDVQPPGDGEVRQQEHLLC